MIPSYQELMPAVLKAAQKNSRRISDVVEEISNDLGLTEDERTEMLPSGKQTIIANRVHWARSYLKQAGLVTNPNGGWYVITDRGRYALQDQSVTINSQYLNRFEEFREFKSRAKEENSSIDYTEINSNDDTPDEILLAAYKKLNENLASNLLDALRNASPAFFEMILIDLLLAMGYGGSSDNAGKAIGKSGDNGIDGVIDQDPLGVDQVYLQAKRYAEENAVGAGEIRDFFGALSLKRATKGLFFTTSRFSPSAKRTASELGSRIVLIDGPHLAKLLIRYNVGCREKSVLHVRELDEAYFEES